MSSFQTWSAVDDFAAQHMNLTDDMLEQSLRYAREQGLPAIDVSAAQGRMLSIFVAMTNARRVLEIGTLGGYSAIQMARALPEDGQLVTLEYDPHHAEVAAANIARAGLSDRVEIRVGAAVDLLAEMVSQNPAPFDFAFIDADKGNNKTYIARCLELCRPGATIVCDNVVRNGDIADMGSRDASVVGARDAILSMGKVAPSAATIVQTVGAKGYDGFSIMVAP